MALTSNIVIDLAARTAILTCTAPTGTVDIITYDANTNRVTFEERGDLFISGPEFIDFGNQVNILETAILFNFAPNQFATVPFSQMIVNELNDSGPNTLSLVVIPHTDPNVCDYTAALSSADIYINKRSGSKTLDFPEWTVFLTALTHYRLAVRNFLSL